MFLASGLGAMGYDLPAAIGACLGAKETPTVCIESDGSLMLNLQGLATLKALNLPIAVIIMYKIWICAYSKCAEGLFSWTICGESSCCWPLCPRYCGGGLIDGDCGKTNYACQRTYTYF